ncbi:hypothetical protein OKA04_04110 [Luteolibacter flavescens]|uniref:DUF1449 family protein n=1 Tax=Luteolibacter flavescens TaxID=1859460 RepID=A0ABT3FJZ3_9BACT|nr:hypothetical protein [Luteolibacter flavescens]MCW1883898.1 hypothetical protein [Luteolibacter flavescens]
MKEIWNLAISPQVLPLTLLLVPVALYWLLNLLGTLDLDFLDVDIDADGPDGGDSSGGHWFHGALRFVNATDVPLMFVLTVLVILLWACTMIGNVWFDASQSGLTGGLIMGVSLVASVVMTRYVVAPLKPFFRMLRADDEKHPPVVGRTGLVRTAWVDERTGQVEIEMQGAPLLLNAKVATGTLSLPKNTEVIVIAHDADTGIYIVRSISDSIPPQSL